MILTALMAVVMVVAAGCGSDGDDSSNNLGEKIAGNVFESRTGTLWFYANGSWMFSLKGGAPEAGMAFMFDQYQALGTWSANGNTVTTRITVSNFDASDVRIAVPERIEVTGSGTSLGFKDSNGSLIGNTSSGKPFNDLTSADAIDKGVVGSWTTDYNRPELAGGAKQPYYMVLGPDGQATIEGTGNGGEKMSTTFTTSRGIISFNKFLGGGSLSLCYAMTKDGYIWMYSTSDASVMFLWKPKGMR